MKKKKFSIFLRYLVLVVVGFMLIYPLLFMITGTVKSNNEIFSSLSLMPKDPIDNIGQVFKDAWNTGSQYTMATYFKNSFVFVGACMIGNVLSCVPTAYAVSRFEFKGKKFVFSTIIATLVVPASLFTIPMFIFWSSLGLTDSYIPLIVPSFFATSSFFVFMLIQFFRTIPKTLDEAAILDGCNSFMTLTKVLVHIIKPSIVTVLLLSFVWGMADFQGPLIYVSSASKFPVTLALKLMIDANIKIQYNQIFAMSIISLIPSLVVFFSAQKYFVEGLSSGSIKG